MSPTVLALVLLAALLVFGVAAAAVGRLPGLVPAEPDNDGVLPDGDLTADDLPRLRFSVALRGYRMSEVDAFVDRVRAQLAPVEDDEAWPEQDSVSPSTLPPPPS